jgi:glycosyltransferase involved in cell wall biosynthesis
LRLGWALRREPPDVFFTPAHVIPITYRGRAVATVHDLGYRYFPRAHTRFQVAYLHWSTRHNAQRSQRVLADSQATKEDLVRLYGITAAKIEVVYPGIDPELAPVSETAQLRAAQERYGISAPYLLYLGTLQPRKNVARLVDAYRASGVSHELVLAGKAGWYAGPLMQQIEEARADGASIRVTGYVDENDKAALLSGATALLFPSLYEGFGFPVLEAQACRTPVMCSDNSSLPEVAGDAALFVDAEDTRGMAAAIRRLVHEAPLRRTLAEAGLANAHRFTWPRAAAATLAALEAAATAP